MKKQLFAGLLFGILYATPVEGQLANGSIAPDFTLTDLEGNTHRLYDYLDQGKTVYLDFFACHCPYCWAYHNTGSVNTLYNQYGVEGGTNEVMVIGIELDENNGTNEFFGISGNTQGNWVAGSAYPLINPEGADFDKIVADYAAVLYPLVYAICPDRSITNIGKKTAEELYNHSTTCSTNNLKEEVIHTAYELRFFSENVVKVTIPDSETNIHSLQIVDLSGRILFSEVLENGEQFIQLYNSVKGFCVVQILVQGRCVFNKKIVINPY